MTSRPVRPRALKHQTHALATRPTTGIARRISLGIGLCISLGISLGSAGCVQQKPAHNTVTSTRAEHVAETFFEALRRADRAAAARLLCTGAPGDPSTPAAALTRLLEDNRGDDAAYTIAALRTLWRGKIPLFAVTLDRAHNGTLDKRVLYIHGLRGCVFGPLDQAPPTVPPQSAPALPGSTLPDSIQSEPTQPEPTPPAPAAPASASSTAEVP